MEGVVPESVMESVNRTSNNFAEFKTQFQEFLPLCCEPHVISELDPIQRAQSLLLLAKATTTLFTCIYFLYISVYLNLGFYYFNLLFLCLFSSEAAL